MSAQTGEDIPAAPASERATDRARFWFERWRRDPNPIWLRELKQSARLTRTPIILMVVAILVTLVIASLGGTMSSSTSADKVGVTLYHTFFSIAFFLVTWVGPAVAANSIASEREGRTWEAVLLSGLSPTLVARGKFFAALTFISTYIVVLAPVGALAFLFGGVSATEVVIAFAYLLLFAILFVSLGLAISSKMQSLRGSILVTLLLIVPLSLGTFGFFGFAVPDPVHRLWTQVPRKLPVWIPTAYVRGDFGAEYVLLLFVMPVVLLVLPSWFLFETTIANLKDENDDRSTGMKRWFLISTPIVFATAVFAVWVTRAHDAIGVGVFCLCALALYLAWNVLVFQGEPLGPSRRVRQRAAKAKYGVFRSFLGPSLTGAAALQLVLGVPLLVVFGFPTADRIVNPDQSNGFVALLMYTVAFYVFVVGFATWLRSRWSSIPLTRVLLVAAVAAIAIVPWVVCAVTGVVAGRADDGLFIASPSPFYAFFMLAEMAHPRQADNIAAGWISMSAWALIGAAFLVRGVQRTRAKNAVYDAIIAENDRALDAEDFAARLPAEKGAVEREETPEEGTSSTDEDPDGEQAAGG